MKALFTNYNLKVRPAAKPEERVVVRVGMILSSFVGLVRNNTHNTYTYAYMHAHTEKKKDKEKNAFLEIIL